MKSIEIKDFLDFSYLSAPELSPNGQFAAFIVHKCSDSLESYDAVLWLYDFDRGNKRPFYEYGGNVQFSWTMENEVIIVENDDGKSAVIALNPVDYGKKMLFKTDVKARKVRQISSQSYIIEADTSVCEKSYENSSMIIIEELPFSANGREFIPRNRKSLFLYDTYKKTQTQITPAHFDTGPYCYSKERNSLFVYGQSYEDIKLIKGEIHEFSLNDGKSRKLLDKNKMRVSSVALFGKSLFLSATKGERYNISENDIFYLMDIDTGEISQYYDSDLYVNSLGIVSDCRYGSGQVFKVTDKGIFFTAIHEDSSYLFHLDNQKNLYTLTEKSIAVEFFDVSCHKAVFIGISAENLQELYIIENDLCRRLTEFNTAFCQKHEIIKPIECNFINTLGMEIGGFVLLPPEFKKGKKYPAIFNMHGGPKLAYGGIYNHEMQVWAQKGYIVFCCNPRGSDGRGNEYAFLLGQYGTVDYDDFMAFADWVISRYPEIDREKIGVTGGSYGGYMTNWIVGHTNRFAAAIAQRSMGDFITHEGVCDSGYWVTPCMFPGTAVENYAEAWNQSPAKYAHNITTPILFIHADEDYRCSFIEMVQVYEKIVKKGIPTEICLFHGENHDLSRTGKPSNRIVRMEKMLGWFDKYLKNKEV